MITMPARAPRSFIAVTTSSALLLSGCSPISRVRVDPPSSPTLQAKAPVTVGWANRDALNVKPFEVGIACMSSPRIAFDGAVPAVEAMLKGTFERVIPFDGAAPKEADFIVSAELDEYSLSLQIKDARSGEMLPQSGLHYSVGAPFWAYDTTICALTLVTLTWFFFPSYTKNIGQRYAGHYNETVSKALNAIAARLPQIAVELTAYQKTSSRAAQIEADADAAIQAGDKARAFALLASGASGVPHQTALYQRLINKMLPLVPFGDPPELTDDARRLMVQGQTKFKDGAFVAAIEHFQEALELAPWWASAWFNLGIAQEGAQKYKDAAISFERYLQAAPDAKDAEDVKKRTWALQAK